MRATVPATPRNTDTVGTVEPIARRSCFLVRSSDTMRKPSGDLRVCTPSRSKAAARRRRLHRGIELWDLDRRLCSERTTRAILLTFTITGDWEQEAQGRMRRFWQDVRNTWLGSRYFCWAELTKKGQIHYQAWWVNPPHQKRVEIIAWVKKHWGDDRSNVSFPHHSQPDRAISEYVKKYVYKMGKKSYQQRYETMPRSFRTFMTQRLDIPPTELKQHLDRDIWEWVPANVYLGELREGHLVCTGRLEHQVERAGQCSALQYRRPRRRPRWHLPPGRRRTDDSVHRGRRTPDRV